MWTRSELKKQAKNVLRSTYWKSFLVSILIYILGASGGGPGFPTGNFIADDVYQNESSVDDIYEYENTIDDTYEYGTDFIDEYPFLAPGVLETIAVVVGMVVLGIILVAIALRIFLGYPIEVGGRKFFLEAANENADLNLISFGFGKGRYKNIVKTMLFRAIYNFFWFLLFIIPGIVKAYAYSMVPYILADNPNIETDRAIEISKELTRGHKLRMWVLDLSFIGWYFLGMLLFFVGTFFVLPYENATKAQLYIQLKKEAIESGDVSSNEFKQLISE